MNGLQKAMYISPVPFFVKIFVLFLFISGCYGIIFCE